MGLARNLSLAWTGLRNYAVGRPFSVSFEVTHCCNARCKHCHLRGMIDEERASPARFGELCRALAPVVAQISGGEPLLRHDLEEIVRAFRVADRAPMVAITTNAALLRWERYLSLREAGVDELSISLDYPDERHDEFRGLPRLFERIRDLVARARGAGHSGLLLCCVVQSDNLRLLVPLAELAHAWGIKVNFSCYTMMRTEDRSFMLTPAQTDELEQEIVPRLMTLRAQNNNVLTSPHAWRNMIRYFRDGRMPGCRTGTRFLNVNPDGTLSPCGLIITRYADQRALREQFAANNTCDRCYTSMRANCEKPASRMILDNLAALRMRSARPAAPPPAG